MCGSTEPMYCHIKEFHPKEGAWEGSEKVLNSYKINITFAMHCKENPIYVFLCWEMRRLNFHIHVSVRDLHIPRIGPHISLQQNR